MFFCCCSLLLDFSYFFSAALSCVSNIVFSLVSQSRTRRKIETISFSIFLENWENDIYVSYCTLFFCFLLLRESKLEYNKLVLYCHNWGLFSNWWEYVLGLRVGKFLLPEKIQLEGKKEPEDLRASNCFLINFPHSVAKRGESTISDLISCSFLFCAVSQSPADNPFYQYHHRKWNK